MLMMATNFYPTTTRASTESLFSFLASTPHSISHQKVSGSESAKRGECLQGESGSGKTEGIKRKGGRAIAWICTHGFYREIKHENMGAEEQAGTRNASAPEKHPAGYPSAGGNSKHMHNHGLERTVEATGRESGEKQIQRKINTKK